MRTAPATRLAMPLLMAAGLALTLAAAAIDPRRAVFAYLAAFLLFAGASMGSLLFVMIAHTARARWFVVFRRVAEAIAATTPALLVLFVPIALSHLRTVGFAARAYLYIATWSIFAILLRRASVAADHDDAGAREAVSRQRVLSAAGIPILALTLTFAAFDWIMPLTPRWGSDILGMLFFAGAFTVATSAVAIGAYYTYRAGLLPRAIGAGAAHFHALGRVLLVAVLLWAYLSFAQLLIIWIADLPREIAFYEDRTAGSWTLVSWALGIAHFVAPFLLLLIRDAKRDPRALAGIAAWLVLAQALDFYWLVVPSSHRAPRILDVGPFLFVIPACALLAARAFASAPAIPRRDPALAQALRYESP